VELLLVRHAIAYERDRVRWPDDRERPLTPEGKEKFRRAAKGLSKWLPRPARLITSPLVRARQTAELLIAVAKWPAAIVRDELAPEGDPTSVIAMLRTQRAKSIALVGHEPALSALLSACLCASRPLRIDMKKGCIALVAFDGAVEPGKGTLMALVPPRALRRIA
jgi:phosphohistidine phosphatase